MMLACTGVFDIGLPKSQNVAAAHFLTLTSGVGESWLSCQLKPNAVRAAYWSGPKCKYIFILAWCPACPVCKTYKHVSRCSGEVRRTLSLGLVFFPGAEKLQPTRGGVVRLLNPKFGNDCKDDKESSSGQPA